MATINISELDAPFEEWQNILRILNQRRSWVEGEIEDLESLLHELSLRLGVLQMARDVVIAATIISQEQVKAFIEELVTLAVQSVYGSRYGFRLDFDIKRNKAEAVPSLLEGKLQLSFREETGAGVVDVASFACRLAVWVLTEPRTAATFILDEPFRFVSVDKQPAVTELLRTVADTLGVQLIIITHTDELLSGADAAWEVVKQQGVSEAIQTVGAKESQRFSAKESQRFSAGEKPKATASPVRKRSAIRRRGAS